MVNDNMQISEGDKKMIDELLEFGKNVDVHPNLPVVRELKKTNELLSALINKPDMEMPTIPEPLEAVSISNMPEVMKVEVINPMGMPEMPKIDMVETNSLLKKILEKDTEINVTLEIV